MSVWMVYVVFEFFNPEAASRIAWFYTMRGIALHAWLISLIGIKATLRKKQLIQYFKIWLLCALLGGLYGIYMEFFGLTFPWEKKWLNEGGYMNHLIFGKLRVFSFYSDASTFGNAMGLAFIASSILFLGPFSRKTKTKLLFCSLVTLVSMSFALARGAYAVPVGGLMIYVLVSRNKSLQIGVLCMMFFVFALLKFTYVGQGVYAIQRMRSTLDVNDASLQVRMTNRDQLSKYLSDKPFGGGLGSAGVWGKRFSPNTWLANFETDGGYTLIRAECGLIGKNLFLFIHLLLLLRGVRFLLKTKDEKLFTFGAAIICGYSGILFSNYGNSTLQQMPHSMIILFGLVFVEKMQQGLINGEEPTELAETDSSLEIER